jgi:hypothetical protein
MFRSLKILVAVIIFTGSIFPNPVPLEDRAGRQKDHGRRILASVEKDRRPVADHFRARKLKRRANH